MSRAVRFWLTLSAVAVVLALVLALLASRPAESVTPVPPAEQTWGTAGIGDPDFPDAGGGGYDVQNYDVSVRVDGTRLTGRTTITAIATQNLDRFHLDLALGASAVSVNGVSATLQQTGDDLGVSVPRTDPATPAIMAGATFTATVDYAGSPLDLAIRPPSAYSSGDELVIAGEPTSATLWYPANDHPRDAATMRFSVNVPTNVEAICAGRLISHTADPAATGRTRWVWLVDAPTVTYATFLGVGQFRLEQGTAKGRPFVYAVSERLPKADQNAALAWLRGTPAAVEKLERYLGPYPFSGIGGFVADVRFYWGGLEVAMRPVYNKRGVGSESLLFHELAHMWLGDTVTLTEWNDIFNNEALASYAAWLTADDPAGNFSVVYRGMAEQQEFWAPSLSNPGADHLFERVYDRGPTAVQAVRVRMGDEAFFSMLKAWAQQSGSRSLEQFRQHADAATPEDLTGFFTAWLDGTTRPEATKDNGVA